MCNLLRVLDEICLGSLDRFCLGCTGFLHGKVLLGVMVECRLQIFLGVLEDRSKCQIYLGCTVVLLGEVRIS